MDINNNKMVGQRIREFREAQQMSQEQLANRAGLATATIGKIERGLNDPKINTIFRIAEELDVPCQLLFEQDHVSSWFDSEEMQHLIQYSKHLNDNEINVLCLLAKGLKGIHRD